MSNDAAISDHYTNGQLIDKIETAINKAGFTKETIKADDLSPVDEFHIGGRGATEHFFSNLHFKEQGNILDVGCGIGGASRFVATKYDCHVTGIDLTPEFIEVGNTLSEWVQMEKRVRLHQGSALSMPFDENLFDGGYMMHVGMNIEDKATLFKEVYRMLRPGASFAIYDVMRLDDKDLKYPVPWSTTSDTSSLSSPDEYKTHLKNAGFKIDIENNCFERAVAFFKETKAKAETRSEPPILGPHIIVGEDAPLKMKNLFENIVGGLVAPFEIVVQK